MLLAHDAILPYRYHLALENGQGRFTWSEKLSDRYCATPFHFMQGAKTWKKIYRKTVSHMSTWIPEGSAVDGKLPPESTMEEFLDAIIEARELLLHKYNLVFICLSCQDSDGQVSSAIRKAVNSIRALTLATKADVGVWVNGC